jgi:hypothetical protein
MGPHNFQKHNIRYPRPFAPHQSSTSTASSTFPSNSGSACAWASAPPTLFPSFFSPALHASFPEPPSPSLSPHYQSSPTFFQRDITPCASYEMGRLFDASMSTSHSHSYERQEEEYSPLNRQPGTLPYSNTSMSPTVWFMPFIALLYPVLTLSTLFLLSLLCSYSLYSVLTLATLFLLSLLCSYSLYSVLTLSTVFLLSLLCSYSLYSVLTLSTVFLLSLLCSYSG